MTQAITLTVHVNTPEDFKYALSQLTEPMHALATGMRHDPWLSLTVAGVDEPLTETQDASPEPASTAQDAPAGRVGWWRSPLFSGCHLVREVEGGWSRDNIDFPNFRPENHPDAVFTPIATLPEGHVAVDWGDLHYAVSIAEDNTEHLYARPELDRLRAALEGSQS